MPDEWEDTFEPDGLTLGPEGRLEREIARSKALKVERLQLRDRISRLEEENARLKQQLENRRDASNPPPETTAEPPSTLAENRENPLRSRTGLILILLVTGLLCLRWLSG